MNAILFVLYVTSVQFRMAFSQGEICGSPPMCYCFTGSPYVIDCGKNGLNICPIFDEFTERIAYALLLSGNDIREIPIGYLENWYSLNTFDIRGNPKLDCKSLENIPNWIPNVFTDCPSIIPSTRTSYTTRKFLID